MMSGKNFLYMFSILSKGTLPFSKAVIPSGDKYHGEELHQKHIILQYLFHTV